MIYEIFFFNLENPQTFHLPPIMTHKIYGLYLNEELVYVGVSQDLDKRTYQHHRDKIFDNVRVLEEDEDRKGACQTELRLIKEYTPKYNKVGVTGSNNPEGRPREYTSFTLKTQRFPDLGSDRSRRNILTLLEEACSLSGEDVSEVLSECLEGYIENIRHLQESQ